MARPNPKMNSTNELDRAIEGLMNEIGLDELYEYRPKGKTGRPRSTTPLSSMVANNVFEIESGVKIPAVGKSGKFVNPIKATMKLLQIGDSFLLPPGRHPQTAYTTARKLRRGVRVMVRTVLVEGVKRIRVWRTK